MDSDKLRDAVLKLRTKTILGDFAVDERGFQVAHKAVTTQWQDGKQVIIWPDEVAAGKPRFPAPPLSARERRQKARQPGRPACMREQLNPNTGSLGEV